MLESLNSSLRARKKTLLLNTGYYEGDRLMLSKNGNAVPVSGPLLDRIRRVVYIIEDGYTMPAYRANRVSLPLATELHIELLADPPAADTRTESLLQWYLDGLHLPVLQKLEVVIGP